MNRSDVFRAKSNNEKVPIARPVKKVRMAPRPKLTQQNFFVKKDLLQFTREPVDYLKVKKGKSNLIDGQESSDDLCMLDDDSVSVK